MSTITYVTNNVFASPEVLKGMIVDHYVDFKKIANPPTERELFLASINSAAYGENQSYSLVDWAKDNWGCKWNARTRAVNLREGFISFYTPSTPPRRVLEKLSLNFPGESIVVAYAGEIPGVNVGLYELCNGEVVREVELVEGSLLAKHFTEVFRGNRKPDHIGTKEYISPFALLETYAEDPQEEETTTYAETEFIDREVSLLERSISLEEALKGN